MLIYNDNASISIYVHLTYMLITSKGGILTNQLFIHADKVAVALGVSKAYAYKVVRDLNKELKEKGFITIAGKVNRTYFEERIYGLRTN